MKRSILAIAAMALIAYTLDAQSIKRHLADKSFERTQYGDAIKYYSELIVKDSSNVRMKERLADSYRMVNDSKNAEYWYKQVAKVPSSRQVDKLYLAQCLARNGKYDEAKNWYTKYSTQVQKDNRGFEFAKAYEKIDQFYLDSSSFSVRSVPFNSKFRDFSPVFYDKGIMFCSNREKFSFFSFLFPWDYSGYTDIYYTPADTSHPFRLKGSINSRLHDGPATFTRTGDTAIYTRTNHHPFRFSNTYKPVSNLGIFLAVRDGDVWKKQGMIDFSVKDSAKLSKEDTSSINHEQYSYAHPCLTIDGKKLFFVSDMPGGFGGLDIYCADYDNGKVRNVTNLGDLINTCGNELFPFADSLNNLYFASDGLPGLGGMDIFFAKYVNGKYLKPVNMGAPINSSMDDFGLICRNDGKEGYFSSNRGKDPNDDNIYKFNRLSRRMNIVVFNRKTKALIDSASIQVTGKNDSTVTLLTGQKGMVQTVIQPSKSYFLKVTKIHYLDDTITFTSEDLKNVDEMKIPVTPKKFITFFTHDSKNNSPVPSSDIRITTLEGPDLKLTTGQDGRTSIYLEPSGIYTFLARKEGYLDDTLRFKESDLENIEMVGMTLVKINEMVFLVADKKSSNPLDSATIRLTQVNKKRKTETLITGKSGRNQVKIAPFTDYKIIVERNKYINDTLNLSASELDKLDVIKVFMTRKKFKIILNGNVYKDKDNKAFPNADATLMDTLEKKVIAAKSDKDGNFSFNLVPDKVYKIEVSGTMKRGKCSKGTEIISTMGIMDPKIISMKFPIFCEGDIIKVENIYYDVDKSDIRPDAALELDKLVDLLNDLPLMKIELRSHTDSRGSAPYNLTLSDDRAKVAVAYLVSKGISADRLTGKGYGATMLLNKCKPGVKCTDKQHQVNRRTEFKVLSVE